jgi:hypothetical protein
MLDIITKQFFLNSIEDTINYKDLHALAEKLRQDMLKVNNAHKEAKYEISYAYTSPSELNPIRQLLNTITKHLIILSDSLKTEQMLFNHDNLDETANDTSEKDGVFIEHVRTKSDDDTKQCKFISEDDISVHEELNIRSFARKATDSYMKKGVYFRPHENTSNNSPAEENAAKLSGKCCTFLSSQN